MPYDNGSMRSMYHIREYNIRRLSLVRKRASSPKLNKLIFRLSFHLPKYSYPTTGLNQ